MKKISKIRGYIIIALIMLLGLTSIIFNNKVSFEEQRKISSLVQTGIYYYWQGGDLKKVEKEFFKGITLKGKLDVVENSFIEAAKLDENRLDLKFAIASTQIIQKKIPEALRTYESILKLEPKNFEANILMAIYYNVLRDEKNYHKKIKFLDKHHKEKSKNYQEKIQRTEDILKIPLKSRAFKVNEKNHTIVVLGYILNEDGTMQETLIKRLEQAFAMWQKNPKANIIVSGGVPRSGVTESYLMKNYLVKKGVPTTKVFMDDKAKDTVGNAIYSSEILKDLNTKYATLITSASHIRRALAIFTETALQEELEITFDNLVYLDYPSLKEAQEVSGNERLVIYRDLMRASGIWAYPSFQQ